MKNSLRLLADCYGRLAGLTLAVGFVLRIALLFNEQTSDIDFTAGEWLAIFLAGALNDLCVATIAFCPLWLYLITVSERKYRRPWGWIAFGVLAAALCYLLFFNTPFHEYGSAAVRVARGILVFWLLSFGLRLFVPRLRPRWTRIWFFLFTTLYVGAILFNGISEYLFWNEFGVRYNFIAVDYLVYTHEVIGNIVESYPVVPILTGLLVVTLLVRQLLFGRSERFRRIEEALNRPLWKLVALPAYLLAVIVALGLLQIDLRLQKSENVYANELQANGLQRLYDAFVKNELDYFRFYLTRPGDEVAAYLQSVYGGGGVRRTVRSNRPEAGIPMENTPKTGAEEPAATTPEAGIPVKRSTGNAQEAGMPAEGAAATAPEQPRNIVLITIESMSASYLERFGSEERLTPVLDSLCRSGLSFDRLYATGNRTVRGLEALTLSLPPSPGQSLIKRPGNKRHTSVGEVLAAQGYDVLYFYGGNSYFDNMESFFGGNGYRIVDQKSYRPEEIGFANIWGVSDEDAYRKAIRTLDTLAAGGRPFFAHIMTVSNHRPFTFPAGRIPEERVHTRKGGVMYSDYALGEFFRAAAREPWFDRTIFLVTADHCASSAGKTELPLDKYHIPAVIFAPGFVQPQTESRIVSQIDLMPTLLDLLGISYEAPFYGRSVFDPAYAERAFVATYQDLGYIERGVLTVLSPVRRVEQYDIRPTAWEPHRTEPRERIDSAAVNHAVAYYQSAAEANRK